MSRRDENQAHSARLVLRIEFLNDLVPASDEFHANVFTEYRLNCRSTLLRAMKGEAEAKHDPILRSGKQREFGLFPHTFTRCATMLRKRLGGSALPVFFPL